MLGLPHKLNEVNMRDERLVTEWRSVKTLALSSYKKNPSFTYSFRSSTIQTLPGRFHVRFQRIYHNFHRAFLLCTPSWWWFGMPRARTLQNIVSFAERKALGLGTVHHAVFFAKVVLILKTCPFGIATSWPSCLRTVTRTIVTEFH